MEPPEKFGPHPWTNTLHYPRYDLQAQAVDEGIIHIPEDHVEYHMAPEIFISDGTPGSVVSEWVAKRDGVGGIHHIAYQVESVEKKMQEWREKGYAEFTSEPIRCPGLTQVFTKPSALTGVIYEFIERQEFGFCNQNVKALMLSTAKIS